jgi:SAM-dependent methyltransferase
VSAASSKAPRFEPAPPDRRLAQWLGNYPASLFSQQLYQSIELLERYSIDLAIHLLHELNVIGPLESWRSVDQLCDLLSFQPGFRPALTWILERLIETGCVEVKTADGVRSFRLRDAPWKPDLEHLRALGLEIDPANAPTLDLLDHAAGFYPAVARGEQSGDLSLFGPQGVPLWLNYFHNDNLTYAINNRIGAMLAADRLSSRPAFRILELGAGVGSGSEALLRQFERTAMLPRVERYLMTEPNAFFRRRAQRELSRLYPNVPLEWGALDLNLPLEIQGIAPGEFDLVYAVNVLHISKNLLFSLTQARWALKKGGLLILAECLKPYPNQPIYPELMFQILESFTGVQTDPEFRPNPGFLTAEQWRGAFSRAGFNRIEVLPEVDKIREIYRHFFSGAICGRNDSTP